MHNLILIMTPVTICLQLICFAIDMAEENINGAITRIFFIILLIVVSLGALKGL